MDISSLSQISSQYIQNAAINSSNLKSEDQGFSTVFQSALNMLQETSDLQNQAESEEIKFALGLSDNTHDLQIAQEKANIALQYTVAVRDKVIEGYKEIMSMQI